jgi:DNA-binding MarR family transcriptional regulator
MAVPEKSSSTYLFGDLLALARRSWVREMETRLERLGYGDYRRSDAAVLRLLWREPLAVGGLGSRLGISRQAARKLVATLEQRGYARAERDVADARRLNVVLTTRGEAYARSITAVIEALNSALASRVEPAQLAAADAVLRAAIGSERERARAAALVDPPR